MRGAGKTTVGPLLAQELLALFVDLDDVVVRALGALDVQSVFTTQGEEAWRSGEAQALRTLLAEQPSCEPLRIIAVGAGAPSDARCHQLLQTARTNGWRVIELRVPVDALIARLANNLGGRPTLTSLPHDEEMRSLAARRAGSYTSLADAVVDGSATPQCVARAIVSVVSG